MVRASNFFSEQERKQIAEEVAEAEKHTSAEIVPVVATASGDYDRAEDLVGLWVAVGALALLWWILLPAGQGGEWSLPVVGVSWLGLLVAIGVVFAGFLVGAALAAQIGWLRRLFTSRRQMRGEVERGAARAFLDHGLRETEQRTGILIYVSLFERMVRVTGDQTIAGKLTGQDWQKVRDLTVEGIKQGKPGEGMVAGIRHCGKILAEHFPVASGDVDELPNDLRIID
jgi:putative membrane protein